VVKCKLLAVLPSTGIRIQLSEAEILAISKCTKVKKICNRFDEINSRVIPMCRNVT
jgi:hypothetical protein